MVFIQVKESFFDLFHKDSILYAIKDSFGFGFAMLHVFSTLDSKKWQGKVNIWTYDLW